MVVATLEMPSGVGVLHGQTYAVPVVNYKFGGSCG